MVWGILRCRLSCHEAVMTVVLVRGRYEPLDADVKLSEPRSPVFIAERCGVDTWSLDRMVTGRGSTGQTMSSTVEIVRKIR
jgi:hypothetical protein